MTLVQMRWVSTHLQTTSLVPMLTKDATTEVNFVMAISFVMVLHLMREKNMTSYIFHYIVSNECLNKHYYNAVLLLQLGRTETPGTGPAYICKFTNIVLLDIVKLCDGNKDCPLGDDETDVFCKSELIKLMLVTVYQRSVTLTVL